MVNFAGHDRLAVFRLPKEEKLRKEWIRFINREDLKIGKVKYIFVCEKHFEDRYLNKKKNRVSLIASQNPVPTIISESQQNLPESVLSLMKTPRKKPVECQSNCSQYKKFENEDKIKNHYGIDEALERVGKNFFFRIYDDNGVFFSMESSQLSVPRVTHCIRMDSELHINIFYEGSPVPLLRWFWSKTGEAQLIPYSSKIPYCERFTLAAKTSEALQRTLLCHAALIEYLLSEG